VGNLGEFFMKKQLEYFFAGFTFCFFSFVINAEIDIINNLFNNFYTVTPNQLYRSAQLSARSLKKQIEKYKIKTVVNLRGLNPHATWWQNEKNVTKKMNVLLFNITMNHSKIITLEQFKQLITIYKNAPRPILIHCRTGADRTGEASAIWLLLFREKNSKFLNIKKHLNKILSQLSVKYRYVQYLHPQKTLFVKNFGECFLELQNLAQFYWQKNYQELAYDKQQMLLKVLQSKVKNSDFLIYAHEALTICHPKSNPS